MSTSEQMNFSIPSSLQQYLSRLDAFIESAILPLQHSNDNDRFFDHRREHSRTDWDAGGLPRHEWEALLSRAVHLADEAGFYRFNLPKRYGGQNADESGARGANLWMAVIREHLASKGLGLFNDLQNEHSVIGNFPDLVMLMGFGNEEQKKMLIEGRLRRQVRFVFGLTEPGHGSDATFMETRAKKESKDGVSGWRIDGRKMWQSGMPHATHIFLFARTSGRNGQANGITCFIVPRKTKGVDIESYEW